MSEPNDKEKKKNEYEKLVDDITGLASDFSKSVYSYVSRFKDIFTKKE